MLRMPSEEVLGVVLAGGGSRRMGFDKTRLELEGRSVVERAAEVLRRSCAEVVASVQPGAPADHLRLAAVEDLRPHAGPLAGLEAALAFAEPLGRSVFLLACDLPHVSPALVEHLLEGAEANPRRAAVVPAIGGRAQPLCGLYRQSVRERARDHLDAGRRAMHELLGALDVEVLEIHAALPFYRSDLLHNLNRPADLGALSAEVGR